ncbi:hypothetical protein EVAR_85395_1 [Eumeta japonica]|uniref:Uncharacterized protein n=1 Tax=Eumeta variegata TaxID=151549 RepID=A0A4C1SJE8_EUMVA|nr:hypothetical protein EVAR_85395_1 [Eumeta japonica]
MFETVVDIERHIIILLLSAAFFAAAGFAFGVAAFGFGWSFRFLVGGLVFAFGATPPSLCRFRLRRGGGGGLLRGGGGSRCGAAAAAAFFLGRRFRFRRRRTGRGGRFPLPAAAPEEAIAAAESSAAAAGLDEAAEDADLEPARLPRSLPTATPPLPPPPPPPEDFFEPEDDLDSSLNEPDAPYPSSVSVPIRLRFSDISAKGALRRLPCIGGDIFLDGLQRRTAAPFSSLIALLTISEVFGCVGFAFGFLTTPPPPPTAVAFGFAAAAGVVGAGASDATAVSAIVEGGVENTDKKSPQYHYIYLTHAQ